MECFMTSGYSAFKTDSWRAEAARSEAEEAAAVPRQKGEAAAAGLAERTSLSRWLLFAPSQHSWRRRAGGA